MIKQNNKRLEVIFDGVDHSLASGSFINEESFSATLTNSDYFTLGYKKQLSFYFVELITPNTVSGLTLTAEIYNGTTWDSIELLDETRGFTKSGFLFLPQGHGGVSDGTNVKVRFQLSGTSSSIEFNAINLVFCNYEDLKGENSAVDKFLARGKTSFIAEMETATQEILTDINNSGKNKYSGERFDRFTRWDVFDLEDVRNACKQKVFAKMHDNRSDSDNPDFHERKAALYEERYNAKFQAFAGSKLSLDLNDDGEESESENDDSIQFGKFVR